MSRTLVVVVLSAGLFTFNANAWMDKWAPAFKGNPVEVQVLPEATVCNFVCSEAKNAMSFTEHKETLKA